jgi:hypothetical protein
VEGLVIRRMKIITTNLEGIESKDFGCFHATNAKISGKLL